LQEVLARVVAARAAAGAPSGLAVVQVQAFADQVTPLHVHDEDEVVRTLEGSVVVHTTEGAYTVEAGEASVIPLGVPHAVAAGEIGARYLAMSHVRSAEDYERFVRAVAVPDAAGRVEAVPEEDRALAHAARVNGISVLGPPGTVALAAAVAA